MKIPKFTFKLPEPQIPHEVPEEFKEYMKRQITICDVDPDFMTVGMVKQMIAEAYKQGYKDNELVCHNKECNQRIPPLHYRVGDKVTVIFPNGNKMIGRIAEVKWNGWCDIDFDNGCMRYDVPPCELESSGTD